MSEELFEVAFSGQIKEGADLQQVKAKVAAMFKADAAKLAHLFSGKRMVIKKNIDQATAGKYKKALDNAGAICEIKALSDTPVSKPSEPEVKPSVVATATVSTASSATLSVSGAPSAPRTDPLGINAGDISDLSVGIAPVGSDMQDEVEDVVEPELDISGMDMAPAGSDLGQVKKEDDLPPPDTDGMTLVD